MKAGPFLLLAALGACALSPVASVQDYADRGGANSFETFGRLPDGEDALVLSVPFDRQISRTSCGAHLLASAVRYWLPARADVTGAALFRDHPPADGAEGYSMAELAELARGEGLAAIGVSMDAAGLVAELELGRPVLVPLRVPAVFVMGTSLFDPDPPVIGHAKSAYLGVVGALGEALDAGLLSHYVLVVGHGAERFALLDPVTGYRTISRERLARYRAPFGDAALLLSRAP